MAGANDDRSREPAVAEPHPARPPMLVMDDAAVLKRRRQRADGGLVPVVVLTAKDVTPDDMAGLARQAERIISKGSFSLPDLAQELRDSLPAAGR